jgi:hypothetical protein
MSFQKKAHFEKALIKELFFWRTPTEFLAKESLLNLGFIFKYDSYLSMNQNLFRTKSHTLKV